MARTKQTTKTTESITCTCPEHKGKNPLVLNNFYNSNSPMAVNKKAPFCKQCIKNIIDYNNMDTIYRVLTVMDIPFIYDYWKKSETNSKDTFGNYVRMANSLMQFKGLTWKDSIFSNTDNNNDNNNDLSIDDLEKDLLSDFKPTKDMLIRWGTKYAPEQYIKLETFYGDMKDKNTIETPQEEDYLKKLAVISLKMDEELEAGNYSQAKQLGDLFSKYMADSKFRAMDKTEADKTGGIRNFSTIYAEVENDDFIPPWEYYRKIKKVDQDIVDKCIMHMENFICRLNKVEKMTEPPIDTPKLNEDEKE